MLTEPRRKRRRKSERVPLEADIVMRRAGLPGFRVRIEDISPEGCRIEYIDRPRPGERVWVKFDNLETIGAAVCWVRSPEAGIQFDTPIHPAVFASLVGTLR